MLLRGTAVLVKSFAHFVLWLFCDPPAGGGLILNMVQYLRLLINFSPDCSLGGSQKTHNIKCAKLLTSTVAPLSEKIAQKCYCATLGHPWQHRCPIRLVKRHDMHHGAQHIRVVENDRVDGCGGVQCSASKSISIPRGTDEKTMALIKWLKCILKHPTKHIRV